VKPTMMKAVMSGLYYSGAHRLIAPYTQGAGMIFTLHSVKPYRERVFAPNRIREVSPDFLNAVLDQAEDSGLDVVSMDEAVRRLREDDDRRFVSFTFDGGYRDNSNAAYPLFKARNFPMTIYIPTDYPDGRGELWWLALEEIVNRANQIELCRNGDLWRPPAETPQDKTKSFEQIYWWLRGIDEATQRQVVRVLAERHEVDVEQMCRDQIMNWDEIRRLAADPLVTIGAHTKAHYAIAKIPPARAVDEMVGSADRIEQELGIPPAHFAFPYGDPASAGPIDFALGRELGFTTAVTTRKGMVFPKHKDHLTALPRVSLNGDYQSLTYTALYLSGAPFALYNGFREVDAA